MAAVRRATGCCVVAAMDTGNLPVVTENICHKYPNAKIIICADDDENNAGREAAEKAQKLTNCQIVYPKRLGDNTDFADLPDDRSIIFSIYPEIEAELDKLDVNSDNQALGQAALNLSYAALYDDFPSWLAIQTLIESARELNFPDDNIHEYIFSGMRQAHDEALSSDIDKETNAMAALGEQVDAFENESLEEAESLLDEQKSRSFSEMIESAKQMNEGDVNEAMELVAECKKLPPLQTDQIHKAIKKSTGIGLTVLRDQAAYSEETIEQPSEIELANKVIDKIGRENIICANSNVWLWEECGIWKEAEDRGIKQKVQNTIDGLKTIDVKAALVNSVTDVLKTEIFKSDHQFNIGHLETVNCLNGELELINGSWELKEHCREHYRTTQIPVKFDRLAKADRFKKFLNEIFTDDEDKNDKIKCLLELMGYSLMSHARHERFVMLIGKGANGKSVLLSVLESLIGKENVSGVQPSNFENRFQRAYLNHKLVNIVTELKQGEVIADAELKAITSGESATVEHKGKNPFTMRPYATNWFGTNHMPHTRDFSDALFRRAVILKFGRTFEQHEQDPNLSYALKTELSGILNLALKSYAEAIDKGFTAPASSETAKREWRIEADQVAQYVEEGCQTNVEYETNVTALYVNFKTWAYDSGIRNPVGIRKFSGRLEALGYKKRKIDSGRVFSSIRIMV